MPPLPGMTPSLPSAGTSLDLQGVTEEQIKEFLGSVSEEERQNVMAALKIVKAGGASEGEGPAPKASSYMMQATDGGWGFYLIKVDVNSDGSGTVKEQVSTSEEAPEITEVWTGKFTLSGEITLMFQGTEVEVMSDTGKVAEFKRETKAGSKEFRFQKADGGCLLHLGEDGAPLDCPYPSKEGEKKYLYPQGGGEAW
ncbi:unnamed protein product [Durusdinium trenchii]|uniref:Uncharacterized protein n=2 Tax=Durusdinium trenchii TaxID=1381693 RepID=A0ABP0QL39_9DINO